MTIDEIRQVCVVGAGTMGSQIAHHVALGGYPVRLYSRSEERIENAVAECTALLRRRVERGSLDAEACEAALRRVSPSTELDEAAAGADLVIESIAEDRTAKRQMLCRLDAMVRPTALLASNSSTMPSSLLADCISRPQRLLNMHFFNPALVMRLVEVVRGPHTSDDAVDTAVEFVRRIDRTPVLVHSETYGFVVNRILFIAMQEAFRLVEEGHVSLEDCDVAVKSGLGWPMGLFELADLIGLDVVAEILAQGWEQTAEARWQPPRILLEHVERGELGRKTGHGFL